MTKWMGHITECTGIMTEWTGHMTNELVTQPNELVTSSNVLINQMYCESCGPHITFIHQTKTHWAVGCKHTGCKSCYGQGLGLSGFTMPLLGNHYSKALHFTNNSMNSPTSCWRFSMYFQVFSKGTLLEALAGHGMVIEDSDIYTGTVSNYILRA